MHYHQFDLTLPTQQLRSDWTHSFLSTHPNPTPRLLERLGDYIMYGKEHLPTLPDEDRIKTVFINKPNARHAQEKELLSIDLLTDNPAFDEQRLKEVTRNSYLQPRRTIVRPVYARNVDSGALLCINEEHHDGAIPGMEDLWQSIDSLAALLGRSNWSDAELSARTYTLPTGERVRKVLRPTVRGVVLREPYSGPTRPLTPLQLYHLRHWLVELRQRQYLLKDSYLPVSTPKSFAPTYSAVEWGEDTTYYATRSEWERNPGSRARVEWEEWRWRPIAQWLARHEPESECAQEEEWPAELLPLRAHNVALVKEYRCLVSSAKVDWEDPSQVYAFLEHFRDLRVDTYPFLNSSLRHLLDVFEELVNDTPLNEIRQLILYYKIHKKSIHYILGELKELEEYRYDYTPQYVSTIYKREICGAIAKRATLRRKEWEAREKPELWKICTRCRQRKLATTDNYFLRSRNPDGLSLWCRECSSKEGVYK